MQDHSALFDWLVGLPDDPTPRAYAKVIEAVTEASRVPTRGDVPLHWDIAAAWQVEGPTHPTPVEGGCGPR